MSILSIVKKRELLKDWCMTVGVVVVLNFFTVSSSNGTDLDIGYILRNVEIRGKVGWDANDLIKKGLGSEAVIAMAYMKDQNGKPYTAEQIHIFQNYMLRLSESYRLELEIQRNNAIHNYLRSR